MARTTIGALDIFLPIWELKEGIKRFDYPNCNAGEISVESSELHVCDMCGGVYKLQLERMGSLSKSPVARFDAFHGDDQFYSSNSKYSRPASVMR